MRKIIGICIVLCLIAGCSENQKITAWGLSSPDTDVVGRVGIEMDNAEVGVVAKYDLASDNPWERRPDTMGGYLLFHLTQEVTVEDTPDRSPIAGFLEGLNARPYAGLELVAPCDGIHRSVQPNWIFGTKFTLVPDAPWALVVEYADGDESAGEVFVGARLTF